MSLSVIGPAGAATVPEEKVPHWTAYEKVHISLQPADVLARLRTPQTVPDTSRSHVALPEAGRPAMKTDAPATSGTESANELRLQIRELTNANLDLRAQQKEQSGTIEELKAELERLRKAMQTGKSKPASKQKSSHEQTAP